MMNNTMYFLRKKSMNYIERKLIGQFNLKLCYKNRMERIFKDDELLITCKDKYIMVLIYANCNRNKAYNIAKWISKS